MRIDLYGAVHKGIRSALFQTIGEVGRTDFANDDAAAAVLTAIERTVQFLDDHAEHEDRVVMPEIQRLSPEVYTALEDEHTRTHGLQRELERLVARTREARGEERLSLGRKLHGRLCLLVAEHLRHMDREETEANRVLWAHFTDEQLLGLHGRIVSAIPPPKMAEALSYMLPAMHVTERTAMIAGMQAGAAAAGAAAAGAAAARRTA